MDEVKAKIIKKLGKKSRDVPTLYHMFPEISKRNLRKVLREMVEVDRSISFFMSGSSTYYTLPSEENETK